MSGILENIENLQLLAKKLESYEGVNKFDFDEEPEAWRLAHSLSDLEQSFRTVLDNFLPELVAATDESAAIDALLGIGEEFRHILYHIKDPMYFRYLLDEQSEEKPEFKS